LGLARHVLPFALLLLGGAAAPAQPDAASEAAQEVLRAEALRLRASVDADVGALRALLAEELRFVHANGLAATRAALLDDLASGRVDYVSARPRSVEARVYGEAAVVTGTSLLEVRAGAGPVQRLENLFTAVYARREGAWRLVAYQSTRAPAPGGAE
jgi:ketosteroid isomerase-like protein